MVQLNTYLILYDWVEVRVSLVFEDDYVRENISSEKGEIAEGKRIPKLFSGTMQKMQRTVTF